MKSIRITNLLIFGVTRFCATALFVSLVALCIPDTTDAATRKGDYLAEVMAMDEEALLAIVPDQTPEVKCPCPKCKTQLGKWTIQKPFQITCPNCRTVYPTDAYPMDKTTTFLNFIAEEIEVPYYFDPQGKPEPGSHLSKGTRYFFNAPIDTQQYHW